MAAVSSHHKAPGASFPSVKQFLKPPVFSRGGELARNRDDDKKRPESDVLVRTVAKSDKADACNDVILVLDDDNESFKVTKCDKPIATKQKSSDPVNSDNDVICVDTKDTAAPQCSAEKSVEDSKSDACQQTKSAIEASSGPTHAQPAVADKSSLAASCSSQSSDHDETTEKKVVTVVGDGSGHRASQPAANEMNAPGECEASENCTRKSAETAINSDAFGKVTLPSADMVSGESEKNLMLDSCTPEKTDTIKVGCGAENKERENVSVPPTDPVSLPKSRSEDGVAADCKVSTQESDTQPQDEPAVRPKSTDDSSQPSDSSSNVPDICIAKDGAEALSSTALAAESNNVLEPVEDIPNLVGEDDIDKQSVESEASKDVPDAARQSDSAMKDIGGDLHADSSQPTEAASSADSDNIATVVSDALLKLPDDENEVLDGSMPLDCSSGDFGNATVNGVTNEEPIVQGDAEVPQQTVRREVLAGSATDMSEDLMIPEADILNAVNDEDVSMDDISELLGDAAASWV